MSYLYSSKSDTSSFKSRSGIDSGSQSGSRIGFRGEEDLGGGTKVGFVLENSIGVDTGAGPAMTRQSFLYMAGGFGTVAAGRQYTPQFNMLAAIDPFGVGTIGDAFTGRGVYLAGLASGDVVRVDNLLAYISPSFGGLTVTAGYTNDAIGNEAVTLRGADSTNAKLWAINPVYKNGPLYVSFNYHKAKVDSIDFSNKVWDLGGTYDLGAVKLAGVYGKNKTNGGFNAKNWLLGVTAPMGSGALLASYARFKEDNAKASKIALGYEYNMSKRTNLYAVYAKISTNDAAEGNFSVRDWNADDYTSGINVGVRHKF
jgi:predicted porin